MDLGIRFKKSICFKRFLTIFLTLLSRELGAQVYVTASSGTVGPTQYTTVSAAFAAVNAGTHKGDITISVEGNTSEPGSPTALLKSSGFSNYSSILIKPKGGNFTIGGTATANRAIIELNGADNVTINGDDPLTSGTRNLTIGFSTTSAVVAACIRVSSESTNPNGADNNTIKNCRIIGNRQVGSLVSTYGINMSNYSTASISSGGVGSKNNVFENNLITRCFYGVWAVGSSTTSPNTGTKIIRNIMGDGTADNNIGARGILISRSAVSVLDKAAIISDNEIIVGDPGNTGYNTAVAGIELSANNLGIQIFNNNIHDIKQPQASYGSAGIVINNLNSNVSIYNNFIRDITANNYSSNPASSQINHGILITGGGPFSLDHNTIVMKTANPSGSQVNPASTCISITSTTVYVNSLRNNILVNTVASPNAMCLYTAASTNISNASVENNNYYVTSGIIGYYDGNSISLFKDWQQTTGKDLLSFNVNPTFISASDLHLDGSAPSIFESGGTPSSILNDIDGQTRPGPANSVNGGGSMPDIGADEFDGLPFVYVHIDTAIITPNGSLCQASPRIVLAQVLAGSIPINSVQLNYQFNGIEQTPIQMINASGDNWQATIPTANPSNASVTWSVTVSDLVSTHTIEGTPYQDNPLFGINIEATSLKDSVCQGSAANLTVKSYSIHQPNYYQPSIIPNTTINQNISNVTLLQNNIVLLNNSTLLGSLVGSIGIGNGYGGSYADFTSYSPINLTAGQTYHFSLSSVQGDSARGNAMAIYIDYNRNGSFNDSNEQVYAATITQIGSHTENGNFTIPSEVFNGLTRMRVILNEGIINDPYMIIDYGEYEDYLLNISSSNNGGGGGIPPFSFNWSDYQTNVGIGSTIAPVITKNTTFSVQAVTYEGCLLQTSVTIKERPYLINAGNDQTICKGMNVVLSGLNATSYTWNNGVTNLQSFKPTETKTYKVSGTDSNGCFGTDSLTVTVNPLPIVNAGSDQSVCKGSYATLQGNGTAIFSWNHGVQNGTPFTPAESKEYIFTGTDLNGCVNSDTVFVQVNPLPIVSAGEDQRICIGSQISLKGSGANSYSWNKNVINDVLFAPTQSDTFSLIGTDANGCIGNDQIVITVDPLPVSGFIATSDGNDFSVCKGGNKTLQLNGYVGSIQWQYSDDAQSTWTDVPVATIQMLNLSNIVSTKWYRVKTTSGKCTQQAFSQSVKVGPRVIAGNIIGSNQVCFENTGTTLSLNGFSGLIIWQKSSALSQGGNLTWQNMPENQANLPTGMIINSTSYRAILSGNNCPNDTTQPFELSLIPKAVGGLISVVGDNGIAVCKGNSKTLTVSGHVGSIQWQSSTVSGIWSNVNGANSPSFTFSNIISPVSYRIVANTLIGTCPSATSNILQMSVIEPPNASSISSLASRLCSGSGTSLTLAAGYVGTITWQKSTNPSDQNSWVNATTSSNSTLTTGTLTTTTAYRTILSNNPCPSVSSSNFVITVDPIASSGTIIASESCLGDNLNITLSGHTGSAVQWQSASSANGTFSDIVGATSSSYTTPILTSSSNKHFKAIVTSGVCTLKATSSVKSITVNPLSVAGTISGTGTICPGGGGTLSISGQTGTVQWQYSRNGSLFLDVPTSTFDTVSAFNTSTTAGNGTTYIVSGLTTSVYFRAKVTSGTCASVFTTPKQFVVKNNATAGVISGNNQLCVTGNSGITLTLSGYEGSITWQKSTNWTASSPTWTTVTGTSATLATGVLTATNVAYRASVTIGTCSVVFTNPFTITVYPAAIAGTVSANDLNGANVCSGSSKSLKVTGNIGSVQWQYSTTSATSGFSDIYSSEGLNPQSFDNITTNTWVRVVVTNGTCTTKATSVAFAITPKLPTVAGSISSLTSTICANSSTNLALVGSSGTIGWQRSTNWNSLNPTWTSVTGTTSNLMTGALTTTTAFRAVVSNSPCPSSTSGTFVINVDPAAISGTISSSDNVCTGGNLSLTLSGYSGNAIQWQSASTATGLFTTIEGVNGTTCTINNMISSSNRFFKAIVSSGVCPTKAITVTKTIIVNPLSVAGNVSGGGIVCPNAGGTVSLSGNTGSIQWQYSSDGNTYMNVPILSSDTVSLFNTTSANGTSASYITTGINSPFFLRARVTSGACASVYSQTKQYIVKSSAAAGTITGISELCVTGNNGTLLTLNGSEGSITWQKSSNWLTGTPTWTSIANANTATYATGIMTASNTAFRALVTIGTCSTVNSPIHVLSVYPAAVAGTIAVNDGTGLTVCSGGNKTLKISGQVGTIQWQYAANALGPWSNATGSQVSPFTFNNISGDSWYRAIITSGTCTAAQTTNSLAISVKQPTTSGVITSTTSAICSGSSTTLNLTGSSGTILWQKTTNWNALSPTWTTVTGTITSIATGTLTSSTGFRAVLSNSPCPNSTTSTFVVNVDPKVVVKTITANTTTPSGTTTSSAICVNSTIAKNLTLASGYVGNIQWQKATSASGPFSNISGELLQSYTISGPSAGANYFRIKLTSGVCPEGYTTPIIIYYKNCLVNKSSVENYDSLIYSSIEAKLFPNPFESYFNLYVSNASYENFKLDIYNLEGKLLEEYTINPSELDNLQIGSTLEKGEYLLLLSQGTRKKKIRFVKN